MNYTYFDVLIIGAGTAGLYTALSLTEKGKTIIPKVAVFSKNSAANCNSSLAQGGIAAVIDRKNDSFELHINDSLIAGGFENNLAVLKTLVEEGPSEIERLTKYGLSLDKNADGDFNLALEGGHSRRRIVHCKDITGSAVVNALLETSRERAEISLFENSRVIDLKKENGLFFALVNQGKHTQIYAAKYVVIATGGIGRIYKYSTNSEIATGDGVHLAAKNGAIIENLSYVQFHPTGFKSKNKDGTRVFLLTEALRGAGAYLLDGNFERFMQYYEPERKELAPRDVVSKCILKRQREIGKKNFYLDISHIEPASVISHFPMIYGELLKQGYDITKVPIPIYPCQHYLMGGIAVGENGETNVLNLFSAGECACTGVHGKNRLASNSLLEALVFPHIIATEIFSRGFEAGKINNVPKFSENENINQNTEDVINLTREIMQKAFFVEPDLDECKIGLEKLNSLSVSEYSEAAAVKFCAETILKEVINK